MSKKILAFGASNSSKSINRKFARFAAHEIPDAKVNLLDLNDFEMPIYSIDREKSTGYPDLVHRFIEQVREADGIVVSFAEHNGNYTAAYKNIFDWVSRVERSVWMNKPMLLLSTSPGGRGGKSVMEIAVSKTKYTNKNTIANFSLPSFGKNFSEETGITDPELREAFNAQLKTFIKAL